MATRQAPIFCTEHDLHRIKKHVLRFYQHFSAQHEETVREKQTYWLEFGYADRQQMDKAFSNLDDLVSLCRQKLLENAVQMHHKGYKVLDLLVSFDGKTGFQVEEMDARHVRMALRKHESLKIKGGADLGRPLKAPWDVSMDALYPEKVATEFLQTMNNLRPRSEHLENLTWFSNKEIIEQFEMVAPVWIQHGKGYERVEAFLEGLLKSGMIDAHHDCLSIWASNIHEAPNSFFKSFHTNNIYNRLDYEIRVNPRISKDSDFNLLNTYLATDPHACLAEGSSLLSGVWRSSAADPENCSAALVAIMAAFSRFQLINHHHFQGTGEQEKLAPNQAAKLFFKQLELSMGSTVRALLDEIPDFGEESSDVLGYYYAGEICFRQSRHSQIGISDAISSIKHLESCGPLLDICLKARLLSTQSHVINYGAEFSRNGDEEYFNKIISNPYTCLSQVLSVVKPRLMSKTNFSELAETEFGAGFVKKMANDVLQEHIRQGRVHASLLTKESDIASVLEADMGP